MFWNRIKNAFARSGRRPEVSSRKWQYSASEPSTVSGEVSKVDCETDWVESQVWQDLEMEAVFRHFDRSITPLGAESLHGLLSKYEHDTELLAYNGEACRNWRAHPEVREALNAVLERLNLEDSAAVGSFLRGPAPQAPKYYKLFYVLSVASLTLGVGCFFNPWIAIPLIGIWMINSVIHWFYSQKVRISAYGLGSLATVLSCVPQTIKAMEGAGLKEVEALRALAPSSRKLQSKIAKVFLSRYQTDEFVRIIIDYLNMFFLLELSCSCRALRAVSGERAMCLKVYSLIGRLDAFQGISAVLDESPHYCVSQRESGRGFSIEDIYHPLVKAPVCNTIIGTGKSLLVSGTNMSGKTTFMKALGISLLFSQTIGVCFARKAVLPWATLKTSVGRKESVIGGRSYFFAEAADLLCMLREVEQSTGKSWSIIDEIFRGTNSAERIAAGGAFLKHLSSRSFVVASTHDHKLSELLRDEFDSFHFSEVLVGGDARFDYLLKPGVCESRNAIKLLALAGYPKEITDEANRLIAETEGGQTRIQ